MLTWYFRHGYFVDVRVPRNALVDDLVEENALAREQLTKPKLLFCTRWTARLVGLFGGGGSNTGEDTWVGYLVTIIQNKDLNGAFLMQYFNYLPHRQTKKRKVDRGMTVVKRDERAMTEVKRDERAMTVVKRDERSTLVSGHEWP